MSASAAYVAERLLAYILPRRPETEEQVRAFNDAVAAQEAYEQESGAGDFPAGVRSFTLGDFSATLADGSRWPAYTRDTISPAAWAILRRAGLIVYVLPTARKP